MQGLRLRAQLDIMQKKMNNNNATTNNFTNTSAHTPQYNYKY